MTLLQAKNMALALLSENTTTGTEYLAKFNAFFDTAQKEIANIKPIIKTLTVTSENCLIPKPTDARKIITLMTIDYKPLSMVWVGNSLLVADDDTYIIEYEAYPSDILIDTPDTYEFEIAPETQDAMPFYAAAMCVIEDNYVFFTSLISAYNGKLANIESYPRIRFVGGMTI